jgi:hypothetical protein
MTSTQQLLIGKSISRTATVNVLDPTHASFLADGEIVVLDENDTPLVAGTTFPTSRFIKIVQRSGATASTAQLVQSARIDGSNVISYRGLSYAAPQEQIYHIGYDGSTGAIDASGTDDFVVRITMKHNKDMWSQQANTRIIRLSPTASTVDTTVMDFIGTEFGNDAFLTTEVKIERLNSDAGAADGGNWTFTNGSKTATTTVATTAAVGDYIRVGTAVTDPIYKVAAKDSAGTTITLDQKFQGSTVTVTTPEYITAALATAASCGVKITGKAQTFTVLKFPYAVVKFDLTLSGFGTTAVTKTQESKVGSGVGAQISQLEQIGVAYEGAIDRAGDSAPTGRSDAATGSNYDVITIEYFNNYDSQIVSGAKPARSVLQLALVDGAAQTTNVLAQLNPWMASVPAAFANVAV